ncbi:hypothetical protein CPB86DRAFT_628808 [Serendipita vermifera]|nr:hypothetical protein CPB86DRAFT_628808 [Serendipita vermifera]
MTHVNGPKVDSSQPPSYSVAISQPAQPRPGPSTPFQQQYTVHYEVHPRTGANESLPLPYYDPRSEAAQDAARSRAIMRFFEAFLWAVLIQAVVATIIGGTIWPDWRHRHWLHNAPQPF